MRHFLAKQNERVDEENPYWVSFSDLMSALLVIFLLAVVALIIELTQKTQSINSDIEDLRRAEQARQDILHEVKEELQKQNIVVEIADNDTVIRIPERTLTFKSGKDSIPRGMHYAVSMIGNALHAAIFRDQRFKYLDTVFIEGHTDSDSIHYRGKKNWGLSADRAISVWKMWNEEMDLIPRFGTMQNAFGQQLFSVSGYAATRRIQLIEETDVQKAKNRRIDIRFTVKRPSISQLEGIIEK
jgi:flagellar motor protein MotB